MEIGLGDGRRKEGRKEERERGRRRRRSFCFAGKVTNGNVVTTSLAATAEKNERFCHRRFSARTFSSIHFRTSSHSSLSLSPSPSLPLSQKRMPNANSANGHRKMKRTKKLSSVRSACSHFVKERQIHRFRQTSHSQSLATKFLQRFINLIALLAKIEVHVRTHDVPRTVENIQENYFRQC